MNKNRIGARQIHLDFHTSELIENIGVDFKPEEFARTLKNAHVDSITLFTRCHHGMLYYDSKQFSEYVHPHLKDRHFLEHQVEACHALDIDVNLYTTVCWDRLVAEKHPEWICIDENGALYDFKGKGYYEAGFYKNLCVNTPYREYLKEQFEEALRLIPAEGAWFDAAFITECNCTACQKLMREAGLDPSDKQDRKVFSLMTYKDMVDDLSALVRRINPDYNIFYNKGHVGFREKAVQSAYTYYAFESLPGIEWGYMDFPVSARYNRNFGKECLGMTSRFHTEWGDFHSFRNPHALAYECYSMLLNNCKCIIGDQLDPSGRLNPYMYEQIGKIYADIHAKEPWCEEAKPVVEAAIFTEEEFQSDLGVGVIPKATEGATRLMQELSIQHDLIDSESDFSRYKVLVLPDTIPVDEPFAHKLNDYIEHGGKLLCTYRSGLKPDSEGFAIDIGAQFMGDAPYSPDFIIPKGMLGNGMPESEHVMYSKGTLVSKSDSGQVILDAIEPVFNREWNHFCSHLHSPSSGKVGYPAAIESKAGLYFIHPIFTQYQYNAPPWYKKLVKNALTILLPEPLVRHSGPSTILTGLMEQSKENRWVLHILHYIAERKCDSLDIIDNLIPLADLDLQIIVPKPVKKLYSVPDKRIVSFRQEADRLRFRVDKLVGHGMVAIEFGE